MNISQELSYASTQESSCSLLEFPQMNKSQQIAKNNTSCNASTSSSIGLMDSSNKKQYVLKTCRFVDKRTQDIPFQKMFLTCLDILIVESAADMDKLKEFRFLASFNYFKRVINIERKILQDWICVNLQYVTMKKIPIKVMQQRLCNSKNKQGQKVSSLLEEQLLTYNHARKNNMLKTISTKQMESALQNKFCYFLEIDQSDNEDDKMERLIYDFHVKSIYFSGLLSKLIAGDTSNLISHITSHGIPEIYSQDVSYFDFWTVRLSAKKTMINSSIRTFDNFNFKCLENIRLVQSEEKGTLLLQVNFDFESAALESINPSSPSSSYSLQQNNNVYKFMKTERKSLLNLMKSSKQSLFSDPFVNGIFDEEKLKNFPYKSVMNSSHSPSSSYLNSIASKNSSPCQTGRSDRRHNSICGFKELSEQQ